MKEIIDLRTDTSSLPTEEMLNAMRNAKLGNDGFGEDPTVNELQELAAKKLGKEAALFVASGTQGNLVSLLTQERRGMGLVIEETAHILFNEEDGYSRVAGLVAIPVKGNFGLMNPEDVEEAIMNARVKPGILALENTHNNSGGSILPLAEIKALCKLARENGLSIHLDGSRIFNASIALGIDPKLLVEDADSTMFCLSKGLCCPVGSLILGSKDFIKRARPLRRMLGGGMRQVGVLAAAGIVALEKMVNRLKDDHENAKILAIGLSKIDGVKIDPSRVQTNIIHFEVSSMSGQDFVRRLEEKGIKMYVKRGTSLIRAVTYNNISREDVHYVIQVVNEILTK